MARAPTHTGTAVSPSRRRLDEVRGSSAVWAAVRPDNQGGYPVEPVRYGHTGRGSPPLAQAEIQTKPNRPPPPDMAPATVFRSTSRRVTFAFFTQPNQTKALLAHRTAPLTCTWGGQAPRQRGTRHCSRLSMRGGGTRPPCQAAHHTHTSGGQSTTPEGSSQHQFVAKRAAYPKPQVT